MTSNGQDNDDDDPLLTPDLLASLPPLTTTILTTPTDQIAALKLVADSIAQQRQFASRALILHPATIAAYLAMAALTAQLLYTERGDIGLLATTLAGLTMVGLLAVRALTSRYLDLAEGLSWAFVTTDAGERDTIIGSRYGDELIGACVLRLEQRHGIKNGHANGSGSGSGNWGGKKKIKGAAAGGGKSGSQGVVRAWTTSLRYRGTGVGTELLEEAVKVTRERLGSTAEIGFAAEHANSTMVLPELFNGGFRRREARAARALEAVVENMDAKKKR